MKILALLLLLLAAPAGESPPPAAPAARPAASPAAVSPPAEAAPEGSDRVQVGPAGLLDVRFHNVDVFLALEMLSDQTGRNIVVQPGVTGSISLVLRKVTFAEALDAVQRAANLTSSEKNNVIYIAPLPPAPKEGSEPLEMRIFRLNYITASEAENFVKTLLSPEGKVSKTADPEVGITPSAEKAGGLTPANGDALVVIDHASNLKFVVDALAEIDVRPQQVLVEATIMRASLNESNALGIDFNTLAGVDFEAVNAQSVGGGNIVVGRLPPEQFQDLTVANKTEFNNVVPAGGYTFGIIKNSVAAFVRALEQITDVTVMANPKVLALNKQRGQIIVGRRDGYITTTVTETAAVQTVEFLETGTKLLFRPFITRDGRIRMEVHPEDSNGGLTAANLPFQETTEATTNVLLKDGNTIMIGGLFRERTTVGRNQVPLLGSIPGLGKLFGVTQDQTVREEVVILLTVRILKDTPEEERAFVDLLEDTERIRVGARRELMGTGRDQLAEARYRAAVQAARDGKLDSALASVQLSLLLNPRNIDAIHLQERLLGQRTWRSDGSLIRNFVRDRLMDDNGDSETGALGRPRLDAIAPPAQQNETQMRIDTLEPRADQGPAKPEP